MKVLRLRCLYKTVCVIQKNYCWCIKWGWVALMPWRSHEHFICCFHIAPLFIPDTLFLSLSSLSLSSFPTLFTPRPLRTITISSIVGFPLYCHYSSHTSPHHHLHDYTSPRSKSYPWPRHHHHCLLHLNHKHPQAPTPALDLTCLQQWQVEGHANCFQSNTRYGLDRAKLWQIIHGAYSNILVEAFLD